MVDKKKFFDVEVPILGSPIKLLAYNIEQLNNRAVKLDLTRQLRGKSIEAIIRIKVENNKAVANATRISLLGFFIRRMMRKSVSYVEDSFSAECLNAFLRIKPFLITRKKVTRAVRKALRENAKTYIQEYIKDLESDDVFADIMASKMQKTLSLKLKKIYPLALCEIRTLIIEKEKQAVEIERIKEQKKKTKREEMLEQAKEEKSEEKPNSE